jgi:hypothetical protein
MTDEKAHYGCLIPSGGRAAHRLGPLYVGWRQWIGWDCMRLQSGLYWRLAGCLDEWPNLVGARAVSVACMTGRAPPTYLLAAHPTLWEVGDPREVLRPRNGGEALVTRPECQEDLSPYLN